MTILTLSRLLHGYLPKRKNNFTWCLFTIHLLPAFIVLLSREIVCQRRWRRLATEYTGVDKQHWEERVIIHNNLTQLFCLYKWWVQNLSWRKLVGTRPQRNLRLWDFGSLRTHRCILEKSWNSQNKGCVKGTNFRGVLNIGTVLVGVLWRGVLKMAAVEHASFTLGNSLHL